MRRGWILALLAACATEHAHAPDRARETAARAAPAEATGDDLRGDVRRFLASRLGEHAAAGVEFRETTGAAPTRLEVDDSSGYDWSFGSGYIFPSVAARDRIVEVVLVECGEREFVWWTRKWRRRPGELAPPRTSDGRCLEIAVASRAAIAREDFDRLVRKVALLRGAAASEPPGSTGEQWHWASRVGPCSVRLDGWPIETGDGRVAGLDRALLISELIWAEAMGWTFEEAADPEAAAAVLLRDLATMPISWSRRARVEALGILGCAAAIPVLEKLQPRGEDIDEALTRIRVLQECRGATAAPPSLIELATPAPGPDTDLRPWALEELARRFPADYRAWLYLTFEREDPAGRSKTLAELHAYDPSDLTLARGARDDPDPGLRLEGAVLLDDRDLMLAVARDATVPAALRLRAADLRAEVGLLLELARDPSMPPPERALAIQAMAGRPANRARPARQVVGEGLVVLLDDPVHEVRGAAAEGLVALRFDEAIPALIRAMLAALSRREGGAAADLGCALGALGAKAAIEPIDSALQGRTPSTFWYRACFGLARISDPRVLPILEREREKHRADPRAWDNWNRSIAIHKKVRRDDARSILERGSGRDVSPDLADRFTADELREFQGDLAAYRPVLERALARKEGRG